MTLFEKSFSCFFVLLPFPDKNFRLLTSFRDLTLALGEEDGVDWIDGLLEGVVEGFGRVRFGGGGGLFLGFFSTPVVSKSMTNVSQMPLFTTSWTRKEAFGSQYLYELASFLMPNNLLLSLRSIKVLSPPTLLLFFRPLFTLFFLLFCEDTPFLLSSCVGQFNKMSFKLFLQILF